MFLGALASAGAGGLMFLNGAQFGALPKGEDLKGIIRSRHCINGIFHNELPTPVLVEGQSTLGVWLDFLFSKNDRLRPDHPLPAVKTALGSLDRHADLVVWLGHSSFFLHLAGKRILIDPVLSKYAAPLPVAVRAFDGTDIYAPSDVPDIDLLVLSHDHWDHMDYPTLSTLEPRISHVVCGLGTGSHLARFGFSKEKIHEGDWGDSFSFDGLRVHVTPARHFSGRLFSRNRTLWAGFVLQTGRRQIFFSGDSGYGTHFSEIGKRFGTMDLALIDMGQYNERWKYVHMQPEESARAASDVHARHLMPTHVGKFSISRHPWDEPFERISKAAAGNEWLLLTPRIGEPVSFDAEKKYSAWWRDMDGIGENEPSDVPSL